MLTTCKIVIILYINKEVLAMNNIIKPFLEKHAKSYELNYDETIGKETSCFEHLINYLVARNYLSRHFDPSNLSLGEGEVGIDGVAIIVNDTLVTSFSQIEDFFNSDLDISVSFIFTQAKTSETIKCEMISHFFTCVKNFIGTGNIKMNDKAAEYQKIYHYIISHPTQLSKNPDLHLFFAYTGIDQNDSTRESVITQAKDEFRKSSIFDDITFSLYDANKIISACRSINNSIKKSIEMIDCAVLPKISNVNEAYIGIVRCIDFINFITNEDGAIITNLFEDNVRYFQGNNSVNVEIQKTLGVEETQDEFAVLNNGITIVAKELRRTGNTFSLSQFQVVNGCQTSFVLYENRTKLSEKASVVIKLISTDDKRISDSIVKTTNRQTPVLNEAFETLRDFHKNLELAYQSYPTEHRMFYERRSKQYDSSNICKNKIVSFPFQTAAYIAVFLGEPQSTHRYYGELLNSYKTRIYQDDDVLEQYCIASIIVYTVDKLLKKTSMYNRYKKFRFHISFIVRCLAAQSSVPKANSRKMKTFCDDLYKKISDNGWLEKTVNDICSNIDSIIDDKMIKVKDGNSLDRTREFTKMLMGKLSISDNEITSRKSLPKLTKGAKVRCKVISWNNSFVYVDLIDYKEPGSIYIKYITGEFIYDINDVLNIGQEIEAYILSENQHPIYGYSLSKVKIK